MAQTSSRVAFAFIAFWELRQGKKEGRTKPSCPAVCSLGWRSGRSPALPYPPTKRWQCIRLLSLSQGDISTLVNRGTFLLWVDTSSRRFWLCHVERSETSALPETQTLPFGQGDMVGDRSG